MAAERALSREEVERKAVEVVSSLESHVPMKAVRFMRGLGGAIRESVENRYRVMVVLSGSDPVRLAATAARTLLYYERVYRRHYGSRRLRLLYVFHDEFDDARVRKEIIKRAVKEKALMIEQTTAVYEESERFLGTTFQLMVLDLVNDLKPNDVGRLIGVVEGGGLIILLAPRWEDWPRAMTLFKRSLLTAGYTEPRHVFISWFMRKLVKHDGNIFVYDLDRLSPISGRKYGVRAEERREIVLPYRRLFPEKVYSMSLTQDQVDVVKSMEWLYEKPGRGRKKVIVVTADRGRGKSCAVGIGLIGLASALSRVKHKVRIIVTAPSAGNVQSLMEIALLTARTAGLDPRPIERGGNIIEIQGKGFSLEYWDPYLVPNIGGDIIAVDEASGIHVPLLHKIWRAHRRIVLAATIHGYEGAGRGFSVRFMSALKSDESTEVKTIHMEEPIRYSKGDPVERWLFDTLLLDAEPADLGEEDLSDISEGRLEYLKLDPQWLFSEEGESVLRQLFGIYVLAHYRNEPDDLGMLADAPHHGIRALRTVRGGKIVCAVQVAMEGGLSGELVEKLLRGEKIPGNIIPDRLLKHSRLREFGSMRGWRIVRIATHPEVQGRGVGSRMLRELEEEARGLGHDWIGSGFGVNEQLLKFWSKNGYLAVHLSPDRNPVSGEYTSLVLKPLNEVSESAINVAVREFKLKLLNSLHDTYRDLEPEVAVIMLNQRPDGIIPGYKPRLSRVQLDRLWIYDYGPMTYEAANDVILELARAYWIQDSGSRPRLSREEELLVLVKALQARRWSEVNEVLGLKLHKAASMLKDVVRRMSAHYYGLREDSATGLTLEDLGSGP